MPTRGRKESSATSNQDNDEGLTALQDKSSTEGDAGKVIQEKLTERQQMDLVKRLYKDVKFSASFSGNICNVILYFAVPLFTFHSGISNLQRAIFLEKQIHISKRVIVKAVNEIPSYIQVK
jgi:hypothetical protein